MIAAVGLALALAATAPAQHPAPLNPLQQIPLAGVQNRIDHLAIDVAGNRLFVAALGNGTLEVVDLRAGKRVHSVTGLREPQGVAYLPELRRVIVASAGGTVVALDDRLFRPAATLPGLSDADNVRVDPRTKAVLVGYGQGAGDAALALLDPVSLKRLGVIRLPAHPESFRLQSGGPLAYVNVPAAGGIVVVDRDKTLVTTKIPLPRWQANYAMALDEAGQRLFVATRRPARLVVVDTRTLRPIADVTCVGDADDLFFDEQRARIYVIGGEGFVDQFDATPGRAYARQVHLPTAPGARTGLWVPELRRLFVAAPGRDGHQAAVHVIDAP